MIGLGSDIFGYNFGSWTNISLFLLESSMFFCILMNINKKISGFIILWTLWILFNDIFISSGLLYIDLRETMLWPLCFTFAYYVCYNNNKSFEFLKNLMVIIMLISSLLFYIISMGRNALVITNISGLLVGVNYIYFPLLTLPWILLVKKEKIKNLLLLLLLFLSILSAKRSVVIIVVVVSVFYLLKSFKFNSRVKLLSSVLLLSILFCGIYFIIKKQNSHLEYIEHRFENIGESGGSGRTKIWSEVMYMISSSSFAEQIVGHGHNSVIKNRKGHKSAHNDFLEVLYDFGLIGFIMYIIFIVFLIKLYLKLKKRKSILSFSFFSSLVIFFVMSMVSALIIYPTFFIFLVLFWGASYAKYNSIVE